MYRIVSALSAIRGVLNHLHYAERIIGLSIIVSKLNIIQNPILLFVFDNVTRLVMVKVNEPIISGQDSRHMHWPVAFYFTVNKHVCSVCCMGSSARHASCPKH